MTSRLNEIQKHVGTARKVLKWKTCSNEQSKTENIGTETVKTTRRDSKKPSTTRRQAKHTDWQNQR